MKINSQAIRAHELSLPPALLFNNNKTTHTHTHHTVANKDVVDLKQNTRTKNFDRCQNNRFGGGCGHNRTSGSFREAGKTPQPCTRLWAPSCSGWSTHHHLRHRISEPHPQLRWNGEAPDCTVGVQGRLSGVAPLP